MQGTSTRSVDDDLAKALVMSAVSKCPASRLCGELSTSASAHSLDVRRPPQHWHDPQHRPLLWSSTSESESKGRHSGLCEAAQTELELASPRIAAMGRSDIVQSEARPSPKMSSALNNSERGIVSDGITRITLV